MASKTRGAGKVDEEYLRSVWDWAQEVEVNSGGKVQLALTRDQAPGTWLVVARVWDVSTGGAPHQLHAVTGSFPNTRAGTLGGYLMNLLVKLDKMVSDGWSASVQQNGEPAEQ